MPNRPSDKNRQALRGLSESLVEAQPDGALSDRYATLGRVTGTTLTDRALQTFGTFYRVSLPDEEQVGFGAQLIEGDQVSASTSVRHQDTTFAVSAFPPHRAVSSDHRLHTEHAADVYLDGGFIDRAHWRLTSEEGWQASVHIPSGPSLELSILGRCDMPPAEVLLIRDRP